MRGESAGVGANHPPPPPIPIALLSGGVPSDRLEQQVIAVVDHARDLLARAVSLAADSPQPDVAAARDKAGKAQWRRTCSSAS